jgi:glycosyltransferase involved in cell wall biosynthesis
MVISETLYIDVTLTYASNWKTGVQRVVRQIVSSWYASNKKVELIYFKNGEYWILPSLVLNNIESLYSQHIPKTELLRRYFFKHLLNPYHKIKAIIPQSFLRILLTNPILNFCRKTLIQTQIPRNLIKLDPTGSQILLLDFVYDVRQIEYLKEATLNQSVRLTYFNIDCNPIVAPRYYPEDLCEIFNQYVTLANYSKKVWSISETAQNDLKRISKNLQKEVIFEFKWLPPFEFPTCVHSDFQKTGAQNDTYLLMVASYVPNKNHLGFLDSLLELKKKGILIPKIYLVGGQYWSVDGLEAKISELIRFDIQVEKLISINDCCLGKLYEHSLFTVFPSFIEGFGLPIVESLSFGKPVVTANVTSTGELLALPGTIGFSHEGEPSLTMILESLLISRELLDTLASEAEKNRNNLGTWKEYADSLYDFVIGKGK